MSSIITRRNLLRGMFAAPAIIAIDRLMPVKVRGKVEPVFVAGEERLILQNGVWRRVTCIKYTWMPSHHEWTIDLDLPPVTKAV